jgi:exopolysaccharide production protein ExoY
MSMQSQQVWSAATVRWLSDKASSTRLLSTKPSGVRTAGFSEPFPVWKRALDLLIILAAAPFVSLVFAFLALYIKLVSPGPVFYRQQRIGFRCRPFTLLKFRTMHLGADTRVHQKHLTDLIGNGDKPMTKIDAHDSRLIPLGKYIRAAALDELAQLFNVLKGDMSIVGPRPCTEYEFEQFKTWQVDRFAAMPGLTGLWQVSGKNKTTFNEMIALDIAYARQQSFWLDLSIVFRTFSVLFQQVTETREQTKANVSLPPTSTTTTATITTTTTRYAGGYEKRITGRSSRVRVLGA